MRHFSFGRDRPAHAIGPAGLVAICCCVAFLALSPRCFAAGAAGDDHQQAGDHQQAEAALADVKAAVHELVQADASYAADPKVYHRAAQRAINALSGEAGEGYVAGAGTPGDTAGALGRIDALLDRAATPVWAEPLHGAETNIRAAVVHLHDAIGADELLEYAVSASRALAYLQVARGRPNESGVFGGLEGALANTVLGVPAGARQLDACRDPSAAPSYGTHDGYLAWIAVPGGNGTHALADASSATSLSVQNGMIVLHTAAAKLVAAACARHAAVDPPDPPDPPGGQAASSAVKLAGPLPALFTKAQALAGQQIFTNRCVSCHGANLQGTAGPSVAGNDFLVTAQHDGWTLSVIRYIVFELMPRNAPASLSPNDDADLMAYLLASNCYPAGTKPFPPNDNAAFAKIKLAPVAGHPAGQNAKGVCKVS